MIELLLVLILLSIVCLGQVIMQTYDKKSSDEKFPYTIRKIKGVTHNKILSDFRGVRDGFIQVGPEKWIIRPKYEKYAAQIYNFEARPDDVWICTLPRTGTTWTQEMIWLICNNLDYQTAGKVSLHERFPYLEVHTIMGDSADDSIENLPHAMRMMLEPPYERLSAMSTRRFIKTHLPLKLMPHNVVTSGAKVVYVARNPKDVAVSYYHISKAKGFGFKADFETFAQYFMDDLITYGPYWKHTLDGWNNRHHENVHFVFYEELNLDQENALKKLANFLGNPLKDEDLPQLMEHISIEKVKKNDAINVKLDSSVQFIRRGKVGGNPEITREISKKFDQWAERNMASTDLRFPYAF